MRKTVNVGIPPKHLRDAELEMEQSFIPLILNRIIKGLAVTTNLPKHFKLGEGHMRFFYDKLHYLHARYLEIGRECVARGVGAFTFDLSNDWNKVPSDLYNDWNPNRMDIEVIFSYLQKEDPQYYTCRKFTEILADYNPYFDAKKKEGVVFILENNGYDTVTK